MSLERDGSPERKLVTQLCAVLNGRPSDAFRGWDEGTWRKQLEIAHAEGLLGLLAEGIRTARGADIPSDVTEQLTDLMRRNALAQGVAYRELEALGDFCARQELDCIVLKGAALAKTLYARPDLRPFGDVDLMIRHKDKDAFRAFLMARGLTEDTSFSLGFRDAYLSEMNFCSPRGAVVDVHWQLVVPAYYQQHCDVEWFWHNTQSFPIAGGSMRVLNPTAQLVHLCTHAGLHHQDHLRLIWLYDIALLVKTRGNEIQWREAETFAQAAHFARPMRYVLDETRAWWGTILPTETEPLFRANPWDVNERIVYALTTAARTHARVLADVLNTRGARRKLDFVRHYLFPNPKYMRERYAIRHEGLLPLYYARRLFESAFKFARSMWDAAAHKHKTRSNE